MGERNKNNNNKKSNTKKTKPTETGSQRNNIDFNIKN